MGFIIYRKADGSEVDRKVRGPGRPPKAYQVVGDDFIVTVGDDYTPGRHTATTGSSAVPVAPKAISYVIYRKDGVEVSRKIKTIGRLPNVAFKEGDNWIVPVTDEVVEQKKTVYVIYMKDGVEVSRKVKGRGRMPSGANQNSDGNWVIQGTPPVIVEEVPGNTLPITTIVDPVTTSGTETVAPNTPVASESEVETVVQDEQSVMTSEEVLKAQRQILDNNENSLNWTYDFSNLITNRKVVTIEAVKKYTLEDVRACLREVYSKTTEDGKIVMYGALVAGDLIDDTDWTNDKGTNGWKFNSVYAKVIIDTKENAILIWKVTRDNEPDFIIHNGLDIKVSLVEPVQV